MQVRARGELAFHVVHEAAGGGLRHADTGIEIMDGTRIGARGHRARRGEHAHPTRARGLDGRTGTRLDDADDGDGEGALDDVEPGSRGGVAGDDHELDVVVLEPAAHLAHEEADLGLLARAVGATLRVAHVVDGLGRQAARDGAGHGKATQAGVEDADGLAVDRKVRQVERGAWVEAVAGMVRRHAASTKRAAP